MKSYKDSLLDYQGREDAMLLRDAVKNIEFVKSKALTYAKKVDDNIENVVYDVRLVQDLQNAIDLIEKNLPKLVKRA